jgi:microcystin-dependent protein
MGTPYIGEIRIVAFNFPPRGWALCNGQTLPINQNVALFSLLGTTYGGNGQTTFQLPNLQGRGAVHRGATIIQGAVGGEENHTLTTAELPRHQHTLSAVSDFANAGTPGTALPAARPRGGPAIYGPAGTANTTLSAASVANAGGGQPHSNMQPYAVLNFCIALQGIFPSRN